MILLKRKDISFMNWAFFCIEDETGWHIDREQMQKSLRWLAKLFAARDGWKLSCYVYQHVYGSGLGRAKFHKQL